MLPVSIRRLNAFFRMIPVGCPMKTVVPSHVFSSSSDSRCLHSRDPRRRFSARALPLTVARPLDITPLDIRCLVSGNPQIGDPLHVELNEPGFPATSVSGVVHWKSPCRGGHEIGVYLPTGLPAELSDRRTHDQRKSNRYPCRISGELVAGVDERAACSVVNYSFDGLAIQMQRLCNVASSMTFEWTEEQTVQQISGHVLWQIRKPEGLMLGCQLAPASGYRLAGLNFTYRSEMPS